MAELEKWLEDGYAQAFRTACLILGNRTDAEEAVQDAYLRAWRFRASIGTDGNPGGWLYRIVVNTCCSKLRREMRDRRVSLNEVQDVAAPEPEDRAARSILVEALQDLPLSLRVPVVLRCYADLSEREIAKVIGRRQGTVKSRLHEARRRLAEHPGLRAWVTEESEFVPSGGEQGQVAR